MIHGKHKAPRAWNPLSFAGCFPTNALILSLRWQQRVGFMGASAIPVRWRFFSVIFILSFLSYMLRQHFPVAGEFIMKELSISELQMGWVYSAFFWGYLVFQIPGGILGNRFGPRLTLLVAGAIWVITCLLFALLPGIFESSVAVTHWSSRRHSRCDGRGTRTNIPGSSCVSGAMVPCGSMGATQCGLKYRFISRRSCCGTHLLRRNSQLRLARIIFGLRARGISTLFPLVVVRAR